MLLNLNHSKRITPSGSKWQSLVKCDACGKERLILKTNIQEGKGIKNCHVCNRINLKNRNLSPFTLEDYKKFGQKRGLIFKGDRLPLNRDEKTLWQCIECGYRFKISRHYLSMYNYHCGHHKQLSFFGVAFQNHRTAWVYEK